MKTIALPPSLASAEDIREAIDEIREVLKQSTASLSRQSLPEPLRPLFDSGFISDADSLRAAIDALESVLADAPRIGLTLAAPLDATHRSELTAWARTNLSSDVIVSFSHNKSLLGGILVRAGSHIYDWSYRSRLLDTDVRFTEVLDRV